MTILQVKDPLGVMHYVNIEDLQLVTPEDDDKWIIEIKGITTPLIVTHEFTELLSSYIARHMLLGEDSND